MSLTYIIGWLAGGYLLIVAAIYLAQTRAPAS